MCGGVRSSCFWRWCWMRFRGGRWAGRWVGIWMPVCPWRPCAWPSRAGTHCRVWCTIPTTGSQYASADYVQCLEAVPAVLSMSRAGRPWENGRCESFIKTLKQEEIDARSYGSLEELAQHLEEFLEQIYNRQ